jgi:hypothetical protein
LGNRSRQRFRLEDWLWEPISPVFWLSAQACGEIGLDPQEFKIPLRTFEGIEAKLASARKVSLSIGSK